MTLGCKGKKHEWLMRLECPQGAERTAGGKPGQGLGTPRPQSRGGGDEGRAETASWAAFLVMLTQQVTRDHEFAGEPEAAGLKTWGTTVIRDCVSRSFLVNKSLEQVGRNKDELERKEKKSSAHRKAKKRSNDSNSTRCILLDIN